MWFILYKYYTAAHCSHISYPLCSYFFLTFFCLLLCIAQKRSYSERMIFAKTTAASLLPPQKTSTVFALPQSSGTLPSLSRYFKNNWILEFAIDSYTPIGQVSFSFAELSSCCLSNQSFMPVRAVMLTFSFPCSSQLFPWKINIKRRKVTRWIF